MDAESYVPTPRYRFSCNTSWLSASYVCYGCKQTEEKPQVFINPEIIKKSKESLTDFEGCLSAPGKRGEVKRYIRITLKYQDEEGEEIVKTFYNLAARCIQHEMDHLEGKLCIDYEKGNYSRDKHKSQTMVESDFRTKSDT